MSQQGLLPTHQDAKLWLVETRTGQEREAVIRLMQKSIDLARTGAPLAIKSCFVQDHLQVIYLVFSPKKILSSQKKRTWPSAIRDTKLIPKSGVYFQCSM